MKGVRAMDILNPTELKSLIAQQEKMCISLYMPTHRVGREQQQDPIRLKNLLAEAETKLSATGMRRPEIQKMMSQAERLLWNKVRLFEGNADMMSEIELNFVTNMEEALRLDDGERSFNMLSGSQRSGEGRVGAGSLHGHGIDDDDKKDILRFFQSVNQGLNEALNDRNIPMVLAGVDYLLPIYRESTSYKNLLQDGIIGNPDREDLKELHEKAWNIVRPIFEESQKKAFEKFEQLSGQQSDLAIHDLTAAVKAAVFGQVETLFVRLGAQKWGRYDAENNKVMVTGEPGPGNDDLFDFAAAQTLLNSGQVFAVPPEQMPAGEEIAAILRYAI